MTKSGVTQVSTSRSTKPAWAVERAGKAEACITRLSWPLPWKYRTENAKVLSNERCNSRYAGQVRLAVVSDLGADALCGFVKSSIAKSFVCSSRNGSPA